jgi:hypothetical protein
MKYLRAGKINPNDLSAVAKITQNPIKNTFGSARSLDINSAGGKNSSASDRPLNKGKNNP